MDSRNLSQISKQKIAEIEKRQIMSSATSQSTFLAVFDFDQTLLERNTDVEIQKIAPGGKVPDELKTIAKTQNWTAFVNACLEYFHQNGISAEDIKQFIRDMPFVEGAKEMIQKLKREYKADIVIISDANSIYIEESLKNAGLFEDFNQIFTNPATVENGQIIVTPISYQSDCDPKERDMWKAQVLQDYIKDKNHYNFVFYAGDGGNDFAPILQLTPNDLAFVRKGYALEKMIPKMKESRNLEIKAQVHYWNDAYDIMEQVSKRLLSN